VPVRSRRPGQEPHGREPFDELRGDESRSETGLRVPSLGGEATEKHGRIEDHRSLRAASFQGFDERYKSGVMEPTFAPIVSLAEWDKDEATHGKQHREAELPG
jgi:hypothetical protein